jgi:tetratricopeptide (TPR) repeat protein
MGAVYKAEDTELGRLVAIKILHPALAMDEKYVRRLKREVRLASRVNHPNVVRVNDLGAIHGALMISMALVEGETLAVILKRQGPPPAARVESFFLQLCAALSAAHEAGVVHRDLKPQNLIVTSDDKVVVSDFGLAISTRSGESVLSEVGDCAGTMRYMSPEQQLGLPVDHRSDIFSAGLILYELLTGESPDFDVTDLNLALPLNRKTAAPMSAGSNAPPRLKRILNRCLQINPVDRYQAATEILEELGVNDPCRTGEGGSRPFGGGRGWRFPRTARARILLWIAAAGLVVLLAWRPAAHLAPWRPWGANHEQAMYLFQTARDTLSQGHNLKQLEAAAGLFEQAAKSDTQHVATFVEWSRSCLSLYALTRSPDWLARSEQAAQRAASLSADDGEARIALADVRTAQGRYEEARSLIAKAVAQYPLSDKAHVALARCHLLRGAKEVDQALTAANKAVELNPSSWQNHSVQAAVLLSAGRPTAAIASYRRVLDLDPNNAETYNNLGIIHLQLGRYEEAVQFLDKALQLEPLPVVVSNIGAAYFLTHRFALAAVMFEKAVNLSPQSVELRGNLAEAYRWSGDLEKANAALTTAIGMGEAGLEREPANLEARARLGFFYARRGDFNKAAETLGAPATLQGGKLLYTRAVILLLSGRSAEALAALERSLGAGFPPTLAFADPNWGTLGRDARFQTIKSDYLRAWLARTGPAETPGPRRPQ